MFPLTRGSIAILCLQTEVISHTQCRLSRPLVAVKSVKRRESSLDLANLCDTDDRGVDYHRRLCVPRGRRNSSKSDGWLGVPRRLSRRYIPTDLDEERGMRMREIFDAAARGRPRMRGPLSIQKIGHADGNNTAGN